MRNDVDALHAALCSLRNGLVSHMRAERRSFDPLSPVVVVVVLAGHQRLLARIDELLSHAETGTSGCGCMTASVRITRDLVRQARLEADLLGEHRLRPLGVHARRLTGDRQSSETARVPLPLAPDLS